MSAATKPDVLAVRATGKSTMWALLDSADSIEDANTRRAVSSLIMSAIDNANDTVDVEQTEPDSEWLSVAKRSLRCLIDCGGDRVTDAVVRWFADASRKAVLS